MPSGLFKLAIVFWVAVVATIFGVDYLIRKYQIEDSKPRTIYLKCIKAEKNAAPSKP